ncbi:MAG TPA: response regulator transcription factor, partial [Allocoleopsis sp.]
LQQESGFKIVGEANDGESALEIIKSTSIDVVILDIGLPGIISGIELCQKIKENYPKIPVLVLTSHSDTTLINQLIAVGVQGYCIKGISAEILVLALRSVMAGASWWDQTCTAEIRAVFDSQLPVKSDFNQSINNPLTSREQEILSLIVQGKNNQEIANILYISAGTVRVHVHAILQKLEVRDRTQAAILAIQKGLIIN